MHSLLYDIRKTKNDITIAFYTLCAFISEAKGVLMLPPIYTQSVSALNVSAEYPVTPATTRPNPPLPFEQTDA